MKSEKEIELLKKAGCSDKVIEHVIAVAKAAMSIVDEIKLPVDKELIRLGSLLHDIGRAKSHGIEHAVIGAEIAVELGMDERIIRIIERHIGAGIPANEARVLGLPDKDYLPITPEEKIVAYADNLLSGSRVTSFEESLQRFKNLLGIDHPAIDRFLKLHNEIEGWKREG
ncbi:MAG: TIGR00295 family protein [Nitrospirae bacterium RBG_19FT_COMBO_42_15]|nr:MAG: TIGR00295 family protein [Nitrospirae bacterium RBG_19FT_COMBO_42_15]